MTAEDREKLDDLMLELRRLQEEEKLAEEDLQKIRVRKALIQTEIAKTSDEQYEQEALTRLYEQRKAHKK